MFSRLAHSTDLKPADVTSIERETHASDCLDAPLDAMSFPLTATKGTSSSRYVHIPLVSPAIGPRSCSMHEIRGKFLYKCGNLKRNLKFKLKFNLKCEI